MGQASNTKWHGEHLARLIHWPMSKLMAYYPAYTKDTLKGKKSYWKKQIREGKIPMPPKPNPESNPEVQQGKLRTSWDIAAYDPEIKDFVYGKLHSYDHTQTDPEDIPQVERAKIRPTRAKRIQRVSRFILVYGDGQVGYRRIIDPLTDEEKLVPLHNVAMHGIIQQFNARFRPETTVNLGDFADFPELSRFPADADHFHRTLKPSMGYIHDFYAQLVQDNPDAHHVEVDSNHAVRIKKQVLANVPPLHGFVRPGDSYPMMTYYHMANLQPLGIDFISGYGNAEFVYGEEYGNPIVFKHGTHSSSSPGATVRKEAQENPDVNIVRGHGHSDQEIRVTKRNGTVLFYKQLGSSCLNDSTVPGHHSAVDDLGNPVHYHNQKHQNTFALIEDFGNGHYNLDTITVINGKAYYRGEEFNGNEA